MGEALVFPRLEVCWARDLSALPRTTRISGSGGAGVGGRAAAGADTLRGESSLTAGKPHGVLSAGDCLFLWTRNRNTPTQPSKLSSDVTCSETLPRCQEVGLEALLGPGLPHTWCCMASNGALSTVILARL